MSIRPKSRSTQERGFTLVELVLVIVIMGIMGALAASRYFDRSSFDASSYTEQVRAMLRYGQKVAIAQNRPVFVRLDGTSVALCFSSTCAGQQVIAPSGNNSRSSATVAACVSSTWACEAKPDGVTMTAASTFYFDPLGVPFAGTDAVGSVTSTFAKQLITIAGDGSNRIVTVEAETGHVH
ncbi:MAG: prepilin-type N-terminal cleavage/methylation domain-containing protein [Pseudomonadota bacterium]